MKKQTTKKFGKTQQDNKIKVTGNWLYFTSEHIGVRAIYETVKDAYETEIWEDAGVLEIELGEGSSFDVEQSLIHPKDELTRAFAEEKGCSYVFLVTFKPEDYEKAEKVMRQIQERIGGFFCGDTEDFTPILQ